MVNLSSSFFVNVYQAGYVVYFFEWETWRSTSGFGWTIFFSNDGFMAIWVDLTVARDILWSTMGSQVSQAHDSQFIAISSGTLWTSGFAGIYPFVSNFGGWHRIFLDEPSFSLQCFVSKCHYVMRKMVFDHWTQWGSKFDTAEKCSFSKPYHPD